MALEQAFRAETHSVANPLKIQGVFPAQYRPVSVPLVSWPPSHVTPVQASHSWDRAPVFLIKICTLFIIQSAPNSSVSYQFPLHVTHLQCCCSIGTLSLAEVTPWGGWAGVPDPPEDPIVLILAIFGLKTVAGSG